MVTVESLCDGQIAVQRAGEDPPLALKGVQGDVEMELVAAAGELRAADRADLPIAAAHDIAPFQLRRGTEGIALDLGEALHPATVQDQAMLLQPPGAGIAIDRDRGPARRRVLLHHPLAPTAAELAVGDTGGGLRRRERPGIAIALMRPADRQRQPACRGMERHGHGRRRRPEDRPVVGRQRQGGAAARPWRAAVPDH